MLFYGLHFSHLVVFAHTVRVTGWPVVTRAWDEVVDMYFNARKTIKKVGGVDGAHTHARMVCLLAYMWPRWYLTGPFYHMHAHTRTTGVSQRAQGAAAGGGGQVRDRGDAQDSEGGGGRGQGMVVVGSLGVERDGVSRPTPPTNAFPGSIPLCAQDGTVTKAEAKEAVRKAKVNLRELNQKSFLINQSLSSMSAVVAAINLKKVKEVRRPYTPLQAGLSDGRTTPPLDWIDPPLSSHTPTTQTPNQLLQGIYTSALACFAAASSSTLRGLSIGFDLAALISRHIDHFFAALVERIPQVQAFKVGRRWLGGWVGGKGASIASNIMTTTHIHTP